MRNALLGAAVATVFWAVSFGIAVGVVEWRGGTSLTTSRCQMWEEQLLVASSAGGTTEEYYDWLANGTTTICQAEGLQSPFD